MSALECLLWMSQPSRSSTNMSFNQISKAIMKKRGRDPRDQERHIPTAAAQPAAAAAAPPPLPPAKYGDSANHLRGRVLRICGDLVYMEMRKSDGTIVRQETGPFAD